MFKLSLAASAVMACTFATVIQAGGAYRTREDPAVVREWNLLADGVVPGSAGPTLPRTYSMMHIAMFDAVNSIEGGYNAYRVRASASRQASSEAAAAQAAHAVPSPPRISRPERWMASNRWRRSRPIASTASCAA